METEREAAEKRELVYLLTLTSIAKLIGKLVDLGGIVEV